MPKRKKDEAKPHHAKPIDPKIIARELAEANAREKHVAELKNARAALGKNDVAPAQVVDEAPTSVISRTSPTADEVTALNATQLRDVFDLNEIEMRIGLLSRIMIESALRSKLSPKEKADIALRAITVLEGSKQEVTWRDELAKRPQRITMAAYKQEREQREAKLKKMLMRRQEIKVEAARAALEAAGDNNKNDEEEKAS